MSNYVHDNEKNCEEYKDIVHCKDCKHSSSNGLYGCTLEFFENLHPGRLIPNSVRMYSDDFCSRGERKGEER